MSAAGIIQFQEFCAPRKKYVITEKCTRKSAVKFKVLSRTIWAELRVNMYL